MFSSFTRRLGSWSAKGTCICSTVRHALISSLEIQEEGREVEVEGRVVVEREVDVMSGGYFTGEINMNGVASGVYIVSLTTEQDKVQGKVLKF